MVHKTKQIESDSNVLETGNVSWKLIEGQRRLWMFAMIRLAKKQDIQSITSAALIHDTRFEYSDAPCEVDCRLQPFWYQVDIRGKTFIGEGVCCPVVDPTLR